MADDPTPPTPTADPPPNPPPADPESHLGEAGKKALAEERDARRRAERDAKAHKDELDTLRAGNQTESEKALTKARDEAKAEALAEVRLERVKDKVELRASADKQRFEDPDDAALHLGDLARFVAKDGSIDLAEIDRELGDLLKRKPYLARKATTPPTVGSGDNGPRGGGPPPKDTSPRGLITAGLEAKEAARKG